MHYGRLRRFGDPRCSGKRGLRVKKPCGWCGSTMTLKPAIAKEQNYCSVRCGLKARAKREGKDGRFRVVHCRGCGSETYRHVRSAKDSGEFCGRDCYSALKAKVSEEKGALRRIAANWQAKPNPRVVCEIQALRRIAARPVVSRLTFAPCSGGCGTILPGYMARSRSCQPCRREARRKFKRTEKGQALRRAHKAKRRAVERGLEADRIDPIKVFERDGWRCHLCGCKTPKRLRGTCELSAPELDHVVPLALGGTHTWGNVACACRKCNGEKGANPLGQLLLSIAA